jgi:hypothetical protein
MTLNTMLIQQLPMVSRNAMDFLIFLPGVNTTGTNRSSTINGMPNNVISITIDGINTQDNFLKGNAGGDGFFSMISPRLDAVEEVTLSTATPGSEAAGQGAVQIKYVTRSGGNDFHGSVYEYHRNPDFNSNYWFNNRDKAATWNGSTDACTAAQLAADFNNCKAPRDRVLLNQPGGRIQGPIILPKKIFGPLGFNGKDHAFFFVNFEEYRLPAQQSRTRTVFSPTMEQGVFPYLVGSTTQTVDLMALAAANGQTATMDPTVKKLISDIRSSLSQGTVQNYAPNPEYQLFIFTNKALTVRKLLTTRFDFNLTNKHRLEISYSFHRYSPVLDTLNSVDPAFPGFPNQGFQGSNRFTTSSALRSTLTPRLVNELRFGLQGGITLFWPEINAGQFLNTPVANEDGFTMGISAAGISNGYRSASPERRNSPVKTLEDTLSWNKGAHSISIGGTFTRVSLFIVDQTVVPSIGFGVDTTYDPAAAMFNATNGPKNFQNATSGQYGAAQSAYAVLTGRVTSIGGSGVLSETTNQYTYNGPQIQRGHMSEFGIFVQDSWRVRPNLTLNYGVRWEVQMPFTPDNNVWTYNTVDDLWGISGHQNYGNNVLYTPGPTTLPAPTWKQFPAGTSAYNSQWHDFAPTIGFAWSPNASGWLSKLLGESGGSVFRGGYSLAYNRNGTYDYSAMYGANPGLTVSATRSQANGNLVTNTGTDVMPVLFSQKSRLGAPSFAATPVYPLTSTSISDQVNLFDPNTKTPYVLSWTFGWQREIGKNTVVEVRYVANKNLQLWTERNINEQNIVENGFLSEFKLAEANLQANEAAGRGNTFKYYGAGTGTSPLPITLAYFSGVPAAQSGDATKYTSSNFSSSTFVNALAQYNPNPSTYASNLWTGNATQRANALAAGLPANEFVVDPTNGTGGSWISTNGGWNFYNSAVVELRRRLAKGPLVQANYVFAKGTSSSLLSYRRPYVTTTGGTLPDAFKVNWIYELPFGSGKTFFGNSHGVVDRLIGGWEFQGSGRWQSGNLLNFGNVRLVGMTTQDLRNAMGLRFDDANKLVYYEPYGPGSIIANTIAAYNVSATTSTGYSATYGVPTGQYIAPANSGGCIQVVAGDCAPYTLYVRGPRFQRFDLSMVKRIRFTETKNLELRGEFLNAFNNINFFGTTCASNSSSCGLVTSAYTDSTNTQDPGGRLIQLVLRINF